MPHGVGDSFVSAAHTSGPVQGRLSGKAAAPAPIPWPLLHHFSGPRSLSVMLRIAPETCCFNKTNHCDG
ncbi:unnamed protein product [Boreogadus saida]